MKIKLVSLLVLLALSASLFSFADAANAIMQPSGKKRDPSARLRYRERRVQEMGGWVTQPAAGKSILIVSTVKNFPLESLSRTQTSIAAAISFSVEVSAGDSTDPKSYLGDKVAAVILVVDSDDSPRLLVAPEELWGKVNYRALVLDNPKKEVLANRIQKEVWRAAAMVLGASDSLLQPCLMKQIKSLEELDAVPVTEPTPEPFNKMIQNARALGCVQRRRTVYKRACEEGWAPAPTNDVQRAIFEQVKADKERGPTNPITIPPPNAAK